MDHRHAAECLCDECDDAEYQRRQEAMRDAETALSCARMLEEIGDMYEARADFRQAYDAHHEAARARNLARDLLRSAAQS